ncbi:MAG TPA: Gfo/Idh/MocA family oxidoreductase [Prolixibacteraceae bacterium]|nr:Gfo/Idh/MocA family oxidoreductase [Prolixibacteraceae bacterium]
MKTKRRDFLKFTGLAGLSVAGGGILNGFSAETDNHNKSAIDQKTHIQHFNMSGYAAPKLDTVRIGFIGLGNRGPAHLWQVSILEGVDIKALCDLRQEKVNAAKKRIENTGFKPDIYTGKDDWMKVCDREDIDLIFIATPWALHTPMALYAMNHGKHVCVEVPAAKTLEECWQLVETSERTRKHCMMMENSCYGFFELFMLNLARQGFFGEIIHGEGAYIHHLLYGNFSKDKYYNLWRLKENIGRNGNLYPTHGIGPIAQVMNINRGDKFDFLVTVSGNDFMMNNLAKKLAAKDDFYKDFVDKPFRGNMNTTTIRTSKGRTIMLQHDVTSPRPKSDGYVISGTKASAIQFPNEMISIAREATPETWRGSDAQTWITNDEYKALQIKYEPNITKKLGEIAKQVGAHGGGDFLMDWRTIDCLRNGLPLDQDVYDAALWSSIGPLTEWSVANQSTIKIPDFTAGAWEMNRPIDILLANGGNTKVKS